MCLMCDELQAWQSLIRAALNSPFWVRPSQENNGLMAAIFQNPSLADGALAGFSV